MRVAIWLPIRIALVLVLASCAPPGSAGTASPSAAVASTPRASLTAAPGAIGSGAFDGTRAKEHLAYLADPSRGGRYSGSPGYMDAARYVADRFREIGLEPLGDNGTYFQHFGMPLVDLAATPTLSFTGPSVTRTFTHRVDFTESVGGRSGGGTATATLAVVGGAAKGNGQDDFAGASPKGKVALVTGPSVGNSVESAFQQGAAGVLVISDPTLRYSYLPRFSSPTVPVLAISDAIADELLAPSGKRAAEVRDAVRARRSDSSLPPTGFDVNVTVRMSVQLTPLRDVDAFNVVGLLRSPDPDLGKRAVLVGGHLDGVGTDPNGTVFQAANDNASGPAVTMEVARALAAHRSELQRSVVFAVFAGEEEGYFGSEAYATRMAAIPGRTESLVAMLNLDVIGCCGDTLSASAESSALQDRFKTAADRLGVPFAASRGSGGSDQTSFAKRGVPAVLVDWSRPILHVVGDTVDKVETRKLQMAGDVVTAVALELGNGLGP